MVGGWRLFTAAFSRLAAGRGLLPFGQRQRASRLVRAWLPCAGHERRCRRYTGPELRVCKLVRTAETHPLHRIRSSRTLLSSPESCPSLFLAYGRALFVVLSTRPQLRGRSNNVQVVDIKSSLNPPTAIYSGTRHLDCGWGPRSSTNRRRQNRPRMQGLPGSLRRCLSSSASLLVDPRRAAMPRKR